MKLSHFSVVTVSLLLPANVNALDNIVDTAVAAGSFTVLAEALTKANLITALSGTGPFTVFAPTDAAFTAALKALGVTKEQLLNLPNLADILKYHVVSGTVKSTALTNGMKAATLQGSAELTVTIDGTTVKVNTATVTSADVMCSNGVIHIIDQVLLPKNIVETAVAAGSFTVLAEALTKANLVATLSGTGPFTVFAPTDAAFTAALKALGVTKEQLLNKPNLADILKYHVVSGTVKSTDLTNGMKAATLQGAELTVTIDGTTVKVNTATVATADVMCSNGAIHVIDQVLLPPAATTTTTTTTAAAPSAQDASAASTAQGAVYLILFSCFAFFQFA